MKMIDLLSMAAIYCSTIHIFAELNDASAIRSPWNSFFEKLVKCTERILCEVATSLVKSALIGLF